jgi:hypothetical protein
LGFVADSNNGATRFLIRLQMEDGQLWPTYHVRDDDRSLDEEVISYGDAYSISVDHSDGFEYGPQKLWEYAGVLYLQETDWYLRVAAARDWEDGGFYNLKTGLFGGRPQMDRSARFARWALTLSKDDPANPETLLSFPDPSIKFQK